MKNEIMGMKFHNAPFSMESIEDAGRFKGVLAVYNNVAYAQELDVFAPGAFDRTVAHWRKSGERVPFLWSHQMDQVLGSFIPSTSDRGLEIEGEFDLDTQLGREKYSLAKKGHVRGLSIGFKDVPAQTELRRTEHGIVRWMKEARLFEGTLLPFPADRDSKIESVHCIDYNSDLDREQWMKFKVSLLIEEGMTMDSAVEAATAMWEDMKKAQYAKAYIVDHLDIFAPETIKESITLLEGLIPKSDEVQINVSENEQHADPEPIAASTQQQVSTQAPGELYTATAVKEMTEALRHWRSNVREIEDRSGRGD